MSKVFMSVRCAGNFIDGVWYKGLEELHICFSTDPMFVGIDILVIVMHEDQARILLSVLQDAFNNQ